LRILLVFAAGALQLRHHCGGHGKNSPSSG
jgi:hypothetical protein